MVGYGRPHLTRSPKRAGEEVRPGPSANFPEVASRARVKLYTFLKSQEREAASPGLQPCWPAPRPERSQQGRALTGFGCPGRALTV